MTKQQLQALRIKHTLALATLDIVERRMVDHEKAPSVDVVSYLSKSVALEIQHRAANAACEETALALRDWGWP